MTDQHSFLYKSPNTVDSVLNAAIVHADITQSFEEYLEIFESFYADDIEFSSDTLKEPIRGKAKVRKHLFNFLVPLHVIAEIRGLPVSIRQAAIPGDAAHETHSEWTLELTGVLGESWTLSWCTRRRWHGPRIVYERHYDHRQSGGPLTFDGLSFNTTEPAAEFRRPS